MAELKFYLDGIEVPPPKEWRDIVVSLNWINGSIQPVIVNEDYTFTHEAAVKILEHISNGNGSGGGIFEALPFKIQATDVVDGSVTAFDGMLDFLKSYEVLSSDATMVKCGISRPEDLERIDQRLNALSFGYLYENGNITKSDFHKVSYVVQKLDTTWEQITLIFIGVFLTKTVLDIIKDVQNVLADLAGVFTTPAGVIKAVITLAYIAVMVIAILRFIRDIITLIFPVPYTMYGMNFRVMLEKAFEFLGYEFESNIEELDITYYIPSRTYIDRRKRDGLPNVQDYGYRCSELVNLVLELYDGQIQVEGNKVYIYPQQDQFWTSRSSYILPDVLLDTYTYNIDEAYATRILSFNTDLSDEWTVEDFTGTNYQVDLNSTKDINQRYRLLKGFKETRWNIALASRRGLLDGIEEFAKKILGDKIGDFLTGAVQQYASKLKSVSINGTKPFNFLNYAVGIMRVADRYWGLPKIMVSVENGMGIPKNHREIIGARALYDKYHRWHSFAYPYTGQKKIYKNITIPFSLSDYVKLQSNSYFTTNTGAVGRFERLEWRLGYDTAIADFIIYEPYIKNLVESTFEG